MLKQWNLFILLVSLVFLTILLPTVCAVNNESALSIDEISDGDVVSIQNNGSDVLKASNDYYFDASVENDGDGSQAKPYKYLTASRIRANSNIYLANGEYNLDSSKSVQQVNIYGSDVEKTVVKFDGIAFTVSNYLNVKNVTFIGSSITNYNQFTAVNTVFIDGFGSKADSYTNNYGGAIYTAPDNDNALVSVDNCTFKNNYAQYGGAIYMGSGVLQVTDSLFYDNYAYNYGGSIACDYISNVTVKKSKFYNSVSQNDAGGSIYIRQSSKFSGEDITIVNSTSTFGGAITALNTDVYLIRVSMSNNTAKYDGGAIYQMYGNFSLFNSNFNNNSAANGGALFIDNSTNMYLRTNTFSNNHAKNVAGAIFSLFNKFTVPFERWNTFRGNTATYENNNYYSNELNLTIGNRNYTMYNVEINPVTNLPNKYSLIDAGYVTPVKDQHTSGNCWAFTAIAVLESCILKASGDNLDLSEENMKNVIELYSDYGWKMDTNNGGYDFMPWGYLTSWLGPVSETDDLFDDHSTLSPIINSVMHVQNIKFLNCDSFTDNDEIKMAIMQYGAVGKDIYYDSYYFNSLTDAYYNWVSSAGNHAVTIVGWDDTFSKSNFKFGSSIDGDGAWIVRNSWGPSWGNNGYFYISYYDASFSRPIEENYAYTIILNDTIKFDKNYQYDIAGMTDYFLNSSSSVWYKNQFTATSDEYLAAVSTYFEKISNWTASVYVNGELKDILNGVTSPGYYTFNLNKLITLSAGDLFEVVFNITTDGAAGFPVSEYFSLNKLTYSPGISYVSWDGENWIDLYNLPWSYATHTYTSQVACIKAFTISDPINTVTSLNVDFVEDQPLNITATVKDEYGNLLKYGNLTFNINGVKEVVGVVNGIANLLYDFDKKMNTIHATFEAEGYNQSSDISYFSIPKIPIDLKLNIVQEYNNVDLIVKASKLINESVIVNINGNETLLKLINGTNTLPLKNLSNNNYQVFVLLLEESDYIADSEFGEFSINMLKTVILSDNLTVNDDGNFIYNVTLLDENDSPVIGREIAFIVGNVTYMNLTDENGSALIDLNLNKGVYDIDIVFDGDNDYFKAYGNNSIKVKGKIWINLDINTYKNNAFINVLVSNRINETFTVLVNNRTHYIKSEDGFASLKLNNLSGGFYNVSVLLNEDEYEFNDAGSQFTIEQLTEIYTEIIKENDDVIIYIEVANSTGNISVIVDGVSEVVELNNSAANYTVKNIAPGNHSLVVIYDGASLSESYKTEVFNVAKKESEITLTVNSAKTGVESIIMVDVTQNATGFVLVDVNGSEYLINLSKTNKLPVVLNKAGNYSVVANYLGDNYYDSAESEVYNLEIKDKIQPVINIEVPNDVKIGQIVTINVTSDIGDLTAYVDGNILNIQDGKIYYEVLNSGLHTVEILTNETDDYYAGSQSAVFNSDKNDAVILLNVDETVHVGETISVIPYTNSTGSLIIKVDGEVIDCEYLVLSKGTHLITAESAENEMYKSGFNSTTFTAVKHESVIDINAGNVKVGQAATIEINLTEGATGIVIVHVNGTDYSIDLNKTNKIELTFDVPGEYSVYADYLGDELYDESVSENQTIIVVEKLPANVDVEIVNGNGIKVGDEVIIRVSADSPADFIVTINGINQDVNYGDSGNELLTVSLKDILTSNREGQVTYRVPGAGLYNVTVISKESEDYLYESVTRFFEASKKEAILDIAPISNVKAGDVISISVINETDGDLTVCINGEKVNGSYEVPSAGYYMITVESSETDQYCAGFNMASFNAEEVPKEDSNIQILVPEDVKEHGSMNVNVSIPGATGNVSVIVDGIETLVALKDGNASVRVDNLTEGVHSIVVIYSGDESHASAHTTSSFTVSAEDVPLISAGEFVNITVAGSSIDAVLVDGEGKPVADAVISYNINGVESTTATNDKGAFMINATLNSIVEFAYAGSETVLPVNISINLQGLAPKLRTSTVVIGNNYTNYAIEYDSGERGQNFTVQLKDAKGNILANKTVLIGYNGKILTRITNATGHASVQINLRDANRLTFAVTFLGDDEYNATMSVYLITINKKPVTITASDKTYKATAKTKKYTVSLKTILGASCDGKTYFAAGKKVTMKLNGKTYTAKTNAKGHATFSLKITKKGKFTSSIKFEGSTTYAAVTKSVKITIK